jgi:Flp pilus assembly pilin Flp
MLHSLIVYLQSLRERREEGQGLAEYALILALIAITVIAALIFLGDAINVILSQIGQALVV